MDKNKNSLWQLYWIY